MPDLVPCLLPTGYPAACHRFLRKLLLLPPSYRLADSTHQLCKQLASPGQVGCPRYSGCGGRWCTNSRNVLHSLFRAVCELHCLSARYSVEVAYVCRATYAAHASERDTPKGKACMAALCRHARLEGFFSSSSDNRSIRFSEFSFLRSDLGFV